MTTFLLITKPIIDARGKKRPECWGNVLHSKLLLHSVVVERARLSEKAEDKVGLLLRNQLHVFAVTEREKQSCPPPGR